MTDRIQSEFELFAQREGFDVERYQGRYVRPVTRNMWLAWQHQAERITDMAAARNRRCRWNKPDRGPQGHEENIMNNKKSLALRTCRKNLTSRNGFKWADVGGETVAPDWSAENECGNGLHGWLFGSGDHSCSNYLDVDSVWMVLEVATSEIVMLGGKCKFPRAKTVFVGDKKGAADYLIAHEPMSANAGIIGRIAEVGNSGALIGGALSVLTGGDGSTLTGGAGSELKIRYYDKSCDRMRTAIAYVGEDGIEAGAAYVLSGNKFKKLDA